MSEEDRKSQHPPLLPIFLRSGADGSYDLGYGHQVFSANILDFEPYYDAEAEREKFRRQFMQPVLSGPVSAAAISENVFRTQWRPRGLCAKPFPATTALKLTLPEEGSTDPPSFEEVEIDPSESTRLGGSHGRSTVPQGSRDFVRGSMASSPFTPGGEGLEARSSAATRAAEEAATGLWLREYDSPQLARALAPGMTHGVFGAWESDPTGATELSKESGSGKSADAAPPSEPSRGAAGVLTASQPPRRTDRVSVADIFKGVWDIEEDDGEELSAETELRPDATEEDGAAQQDKETSGRPSQPPSDPSGESVEATTLLPSPTVKQQKRPAEADWAVRGGVQDVDAAFDALRPTLAMTFPFELDRFQKEAVIHLEKGESVFVAAHTSAGKTLVAEYALALARQHCTRAIYTSPIKTISNQKYRDFSAQFEVGLLTGDISLKPEAASLIMTTEILRSMLYKGADIIRDVEWVIFDEVHYVNDAERGVVWEEVIIMLPAHVNLVLLSATVPNVMEFADWVGRTKRKRIYVTGTTRRPVPLEHSLYYDGELHTVLRNDTYLPEGILHARKAWKAKNAPPQLTKSDAKAARPTGRGDGRGANQQARGGAARGGPGRLARGGASNPNHARAIAHATGGGRSGAPSERTFWTNLVKLLDKRQLLPAVAFCFSKKKVDQLAEALPGLDLTTATEKSAIRVFLDGAVSRLREADRGLPQIQRLREMLGRGLGVHHAGLLPIMKEVVEMLFCRGVVKLLFSTETFAMGVNAPARTVVFQGLRKHDGKAFRTLLSGEYTQMAGRAGRRGLDPVGTVLIACASDLPEEGEIRTLLTGRATRLESQFRLTYTMILNLLRVEDLKVEDMLKRSFAEFHAQRAQPEALVALEEGAKRLRALQARPFPEAYMDTSRRDVEEFHDLAMAIADLSARLQDKIMASRAAQQVLVSGRLVLVANDASKLQELAVICGTVTKSRNPLLVSGSSTEGKGDYYALLLSKPTPLKGEAPEAEVAKETPNTQSKSLGPGLILKATGKRAGIGPMPRHGNVSGLDYALREVLSAEIEEICSEKIAVDADAVLRGEDVSAVAAAVGQLQRVSERAGDAGGSLATLDPEKDLKIHQFDLVQDIRERRRLQQIRAELPCQREPAFGEMWALVHSEAVLTARLAGLSHQISDANLQQMPDFHQRVRVLQELDYVSQDDTVAVKGRVACEVNAADELVTTEIIFAGVLAELSPEEAIAALSALVFKEKSEAEGAPAPTAGLEDARHHMQTLAKHAAEVQRDCGLDIVPDDFVKDTLKFGLMEVVYLWASGTGFDEISRGTDVMEGSIVRCVVRLDELSRQLRDAARVMGNTALFQQMEAASLAIKRDIVFAASLYTT